MTAKSCTAAVLCCLLAGLMLGAPAESARTKRTDRSCKARGKTIEENTRARIYAVRDGDLEIYACQISPATRRPHTFMGLFSRTLGISGLVLEGRFAGSIGRGGGCSRGRCEDDQIEITNTRTGNTRQVTGDVLALRSDGVVATLSDGASSGPDQQESVVRISDRNGLREVYRGPRVDRDSLAISKNSAFWVSGGQTFREPALGPYR